jgi:hypothetical protein
MKKLLALVALVALLLGLSGTALAADETLGHTGRVVIVAGGDVAVAADEQADAVIVLRGDARIEGTVNALVVVDGTATVSGATLESIAIVNGTANIDRATTILDDVMRFESTVNVADGATIGGSVRDMTGDLVTFGIWIGAAAILIWVGVAVATLVFALLAVGLASRQIRGATALISREPGRVALVGLASMIVPPVVAVLAMITLVGIPTGLAILFMIWPAVAFAGYVVAAIWLGQWLLNRRDGTVPSERPYRAAVVGLLVAFVIGFIPLATAVLSILGLGAVVLAGWRTLRRRDETAAEPALIPQPAPLG